jgi:heat shock protein HspQ
MQILSVPECTKSNCKTCDLDGACSKCSDGYYKSGTDCKSKASLPFFHTLILYDDVSAVLYIADCLLQSSVTV